ncbi:MAG TPA: hypothetical protein PK781_02425 [Terrimesophilobacter sp.]|nr:hypothetical protein [Terrimesophilobacter sp.]HRP99301.1 hypothetical protein [Terrimesophilobacter sp.]
MATPSRRERFRPVELIGLSAAFALFTGLVVAMSTKDWIIAGIAFGVTFIVSLVVLAMLALTAGSDDSSKDGSQGPVL